MSWDVIGLGNALMDALVVLKDDSLFDKLQLTRGQMHPKDDAEWQTIFKEVAHMDVVYASGGSCANTIATVGRLGGKALYAGQVGDDELGHHYAKLITEACGSHALRFSPDKATGKCLSMISEADAERTMVTDLGASVALDEISAFSDQMGQTQIAHFTGYTLLDGPMQKSASASIEAAHAAGATISLDIADPFVIGLIRERLLTTITERVDIVFCNEQEAKALMELDNAVDAGRALAEKSKVDTVVVKLGREGSVIFKGGEEFRVGITPIKAVDTTGAGDAYAAGFLYGVTQGWAPMRCGDLAAAVAALTVKQMGAVVQDRALLAAAIAQTA